MASRRFFLAAACVILTACGHEDDPVVSTPFGDFRTAYVSRSYLLTPNQVRVDQLASLISRRFPHRDDPQLPNAAVAHKIVATSICFGLDAAILAGLVRQESAYDRFAVSPTGASGLTQFTTLGIREASDQLGERGTSYGRADATRYFNETITGCAQTATLDRPWTHLWRRLGDGNGLGLVDQRNLLRGDADASLVYGAVLLKTLLSVARTRLGEVAAETLYADALERYNGDPDAEVRRDYVTRVLRYAAETREVRSP